MKVEDGVPPSVAVTELWLSLVFFIGLDAMLGAVDGALMFRYGRRALGEGEGDDEEPEAPSPDDTSSLDEEPVPALTY
jgi:hypothetical protein